MRAIHARVRSPALASRRLCGGAAGAGSPPRAACRTPRPPCGCSTTAFRPTGPSPDRGRARRLSSAPALAALVCPPADRGAVWGCVTVLRGWVHLAAPLRLPILARNAPARRPQASDEAVAVPRVCCSAAAPVAVARPPARRRSAGPLEWNGCQCRPRPGVPEGRTAVGSSCACRWRNPGTRGRPAAVSRSGTGQRPPLLARYAVQDAVRLRMFARRGDLRT